MLGKMLLHGVAAAILIGSAAAVYAQVGDGDTSPPLPAPSAQRDAGAGQAADGYLHPAVETAGRDGHRAAHSDHGGRGENGESNRDDDDD